MPSDDTNSFNYDEASRRSISSNSSSSSFTSFASISSIIMGFNNRVSQVKSTYFQKRLQSYATRNVLQKNSCYLSDIPCEKLFEYWKRIAKFRYSDIPTSERVFVIALIGLVIYLKVLKFAESFAETILTSKAVESVWYAWKCYDKSFTETSFDDFCVKILDLEFSPKFPDRTHLCCDPEEALARTYVFNCKVDGLNFKRRFLPSLFRLDRIVKMPWGLNYCIDLNNKYIAHTWLNRDGLPMAKAVPLIHSKICLRTFFDLNLTDDIPDDNEIFKDVKEDGPLEEDETSFCIKFNIY